MPDHVNPQQYRETLDSLLEGFQIIGRDWTYLYVNPSAASQGRSTPAQLHGRKMWDAYPGIDETPLFDELRRCMDQRTPTALENLFTYPDGSQRWFELRIEPVPQGICIHSFDVHDRKTAQDALVRLNGELELRVAERTRELEDLNTELESFSHSVSHDLRAPIRHVNGFASALAEDAGPGLSDEARDYLVRILRATERMSSMIENLLSMSRLGRTPLHKQPVDLYKLVETALVDVAPETSGRDIRWSIAPLPWVHADPQLLRLALVNLLSNAVKYTRGRSPAHISIGTEKSEVLNEAIVWVRDDGVGFDMSAAKTLFGVFQRLHTDAEFEGTGIGLANVRRIVARHGGRTWAEGAVGKGATFFVSLPRAVE